MDTRWRMNFSLTVSEMRGFWAGLTGMLLLALSHQTLAEERIGSGTSFPLRCGQHGFWAGGRGCQYFHRLLGCDLRSAFIEHVTSCRRDQLEAHYVSLSIQSQMTGKQRTVCKDLVESLHWIWWRSRNIMATFIFYPQFFTLPCLPSPPLPSRPFSIPFPFSLPLHSPLPAFLSLARFFFPFRFSFFSPLFSRQDLI